MVVLEGSSEHGRASCGSLKQFTAPQTDWASASSLPVQQMFKHKLVPECFATDG